MYTVICESETMNILLLAIVNFSNRLLNKYNLLRKKNSSVDYIGEFNEIQL